MKKVWILFLLLGIFGCSSTNIVTMSVVEPAPVDVPSNMKKIGIINRSLPSERNKSLDKVDKVLSMEGKNLDMEGATQSVSGLVEELRRNAKLEKVIILEESQLENPAFGVFPSSLSWNNVTQICQKNNLDGLFLLEYYDTDGAIEYSTKQVMLKNPLGISIPMLEHVATVRTIIKTGWRIYDKNNKNIIDEYAITKEVFTSGSGINPLDALKAITGRKEAVKSISYDIGRSYAQSILPFNTRVSRDYYVRGTDNFKIAKRYAQTGNWDGAAKLWEKEIFNRKTKVAGRANYNMAIISEINGDLDLAIDWAKKSYENFNNKLGLNYLRTLQNRKAKAQKLARQQL